MIYGGILSVKAIIRQVKYFNNIIEQDHRFIKRKVKPMLGFASFEIAVKTIFRNLNHAYDQKGAG